LSNILSELRESGKCVSVNFNLLTAVFQCDKERASNIKTACAYGEKGLNIIYSLWLTNGNSKTEAVYWSEL
jgi:hypothetical protein